MSNLIDIKVPDIGDFKDVPVIEVFVNIGDSVKAEDPLVSLESDKATMDVPAPHGGVVTAIPIKVGDKVSEGSVIMRFQGNGAAAPMPEPAAGGLRVARECDRFAEAVLPVRQNREPLVERLRPLDRHGHERALLERRADEPVQPG